jgi:hypothetical protein
MWRGKAEYWIISEQMPINTASAREPFAGAGSRDATGERREQAREAEHLHPEEAAKLIEEAATSHTPTR